MTKLKQFDMMLNMFWFEQHDVIINFKIKFITFKSDYCLNYCIHNYMFTTIYNNNFEHKRRHSHDKISNDASKNSNECKTKSQHTKNITTMNVTTFMKLIKKRNNQIIVMWFAHFEMLNQFEKMNIFFCASFLTTNVAAISTNDYNKFFNKNKKNYWQWKNWRKKYQKCFTNTFSHLIRKKQTSFSHIKNEITKSI